MGGKADSPKSEILKAHFSELNQHAMRDMLSGLLSRGAMELYINDKLQSMSEGENCAFFLLLIWIILSRSTIPSDILWVIRPSER